MEEQLWKCGMTQSLQLTDEPRVYECDAPILNIWSKRSCTAAENNMASHMSLGVDVLSTPRSKQQSRAIP